MPLVLEQAKDWTCRELSGALSPIPAKLTNEGALHCIYSGTSLCDSSCRQQRVELCKMPCIAVDCNKDHTIRDHHGYCFRAKDGVREHREG